MESDPIVARFASRTDDEPALKTRVRELRASHPSEPDDMLAGRLVATFPLRAIAHEAEDGRDAILPVERRRKALATLGGTVPPEILDGVPVRWADEPADLETIVSLWRAREASGRREPVLGYVHLPFCRTKCSFCQFESLVGHREDEVDHTIDAIRSEASALRAAIGATRVAAMTIGGGTPSELSAAQLERLLEGVIGVAILVEEGTYFSVELNPDSTDEDKLLAMVSRGVNRVSFGVQSLHEPTLRAVARGYQERAMVASAIAAAHRVGGHKIAAALIASLPDESRASFRDGVRALIGYGPDQICLYAYQSVTRRGRTIDAGALSHDEAAAILREEGERAGYAPLPHTGSTLVVERAGSRTFAQRYVQHAREPSSLLGLGPFAESHVFGVASYVADADLRLAAPYRVMRRTLDEELAAYVGRRLAAGLAIERGAIEANFGAGVEALVPAALGWSLEQGSLRAVDGGYAGPEGERDRALDAAWSFLDARSVVRLRRRHGASPRGALEAVGETDRRFVSERLDPLSDLALSAEPVRLVGMSYDEGGVSVRLAVEDVGARELDAALRAAKVRTRELAALQGAGMLAELVVTITKSRTRARATLTAPLPASMWELFSHLEVSQAEWMTRASAVVIDVSAAGLEWVIDQANSLYEILEVGLPPEVYASLGRSRVGFSRLSDGRDALSAVAPEGEVLDAPWPRPIGRVDGVRSARWPLHALRPEMKGLELEIAPRARGLRVVR
ncbi:MAG: radical SAM protein [Sandaracinaceae bacterium]